MSTRTLKLSTLVLLTALAAWGCAEPPEAEVAAAREALTAAETAEAQTWAPEAYQEAQAAMDAANAEISAQAEKFAMTRSYDEAERLVAEAQAKAEAAQQAAAEGEEQARVEAETALQTARTSLDQAATLLGEVEACNRRPKGFETDVVALRASLGGLEAQYGEARTACESGDHLAGGSAAGAVGTAATTLVTDLDAAKTRLGC